MIAADQPDCFPDGVHVFVSSVDDGSVLDRSGATPDDEILENRTRFVSDRGFDYQNCANQIIEYGDDKTYDVIAIAAASDIRREIPGISADAIIVKEPQVGVFLPVADCVATVAYDTVRQVFAVMHLGRHSTLAKLMDKTLRAMKNDGSNPEDIIIWMGPSVQGTHYRLQYFTQEHDPEWQGFYSKDEDGYLIDMQQYNASRAQYQGVPRANIHISSVNTAVNDNYFSHSQGDTNGRFAVVAWLA